MHKLERPSPPDCLKKFQHGRHTWRNLSAADKIEIWQKLDEMQKHRCAYCETDTGSNPGTRNAHIEHFRQRSRYPQGTFEWANLFGSCNRLDSCGHHKDSLPAYNPDDLIKMDEENPDDFFYFEVDGGISLRKGLTEEQKHRAREPLRIFNLNANHGPLRHMRKAAVQGYISTAEEFALLALEYREEEWMPFFEQELKQIKNLPFATAIKHTLMPY